MHENENFKTDVDSQMVEQIILAVQRSAGNKSSPPATSPSK